MPTINIRPGDSGTIPVHFQDSDFQQFVTPRNSGTLTLTTTNCSLYIYDGATDPPTELIKAVNGVQRSIILVADHPYMVQVAGTTDANPNGSVAWSFT